MFESIASKYNIDYTISPPKDAEGDHLCQCWGGSDGKGNYTGLIGDLYNNWCDIGWANLYDTDMHRATADLSVPYSFDRTCFIVRSWNILQNDNEGEKIVDYLQLRKPSELPKFMVLIQPFSPEVWVGVTMTVAVCLIMIIICGIMEPIKGYSYGELVFILIGSFLHQSQHGIIKFQPTALRLVFHQTRYQ